MGEAGRWEPGDQIVLREVWRGKICSAKPVTVVADQRDWVALHLAEGTRWKQPRRLDGGPVTPETRMGDEWRLVECVYSMGENLLLARRGDPSCIQLMWGPGRAEFQWWYVNLQEPFRPMSAGFDYMDWLLDMVVSPDPSEWRWKDEDELAQALGLGLMSPTQARDLRAEGLRAVELLRAGGPPFDRDWQSWRPDPIWPVPEQPVGWDVVQ